MPLWETPEEWATEFLRSQKFNKEVRDKQKFLFKRPRAQVTLSGAGTLTIPVARAFIDETSFIAVIEKTERPLIVTITGGLAKDAAAATNNIASFDLLTSDGGWVSARGGLTPLSLGAGRAGWFVASQQAIFNITMLIDWLPAGVYTLKPTWMADVAMSVNTAIHPLDMFVEEI